MSDQFICSKDELKKRLNGFPGDVDFTDFPDLPNSLFSWINGHCFMWVQTDGEWKCEEL